MPEAIALLAAACAAPRQAPPAGVAARADAARESLAAAERAFARDSVERGMRAAFLEHFADDGINFSPGPGNTKERFRARPEAIEPFILDWHPAIAAVARAGDLGFTTGPYTITGRPPAAREPANGRVLFGLAPAGRRPVACRRRRRRVDAGAVPDAAFGEDPRPLAPVVAATSDAEQKRELTALEAQLQAGDAPAAAGGYAALLADDALLIVGPTPPSLGRDAIIASLAERGLKFRCETLAAGVSRSDDLAYTYGRLHRLDAAGNAGGHYVHVWMRDRGGRWRISAELILLPS